MKKENIKALITESGKEAIPVNPFEFKPQGAFDNPDDETFKNNRLHVEFNQAHPKRELVTPREDLAGSVVEVVEVWQYQFRMGGEWTTATPNIMSYFDNYEAFATYYYNQNDCATRQAYQVEAVKEEKPKVPCPVCFGSGYIRYSAHTRTVCDACNGRKTVLVTEKVEIEDYTTPIVQGSEESVPNDYWQVVYASIAYGLSIAELENKSQSDGIKIATDAIVDYRSKLDVNELAFAIYPVPVGHANALMKPLRVSERNAFMKGYQQRNDEVVAIIEKRVTEIDVLLTRCDDNWTIESEYLARKDELTNLLSTITKTP